MVNDRLGLLPGHSSLCLLSNLGIDLRFPRTMRYSTDIIIPVSLGIILITAPLLACIPSLRFRVHISFIPPRQCLPSIPTARIPRPLRSILRKYIPKFFFHLFSKSPPVYSTYPDPISEEAYWKTALLGQRELASSNATIRSGNATPGLIVYYTPALLPVYRDRDKKGTKGVEEGRVYISPRTFLEWHRLVFPEFVHPTLEQASRRRWNYSDRDRREMRRIVKIGRRAAVRSIEGQHQRTRQYKGIWRRRVEGRDSEQHWHQLVVTFARS